jgi:hypothetical protein
MCMLLRELRPTKIVRAERCYYATGCGSRQSCNMTASQINHMDEVPNGCSIWGIPISTKDVQHWLAPG